MKKKLGNSKSYFPIHGLEYLIDIEISDIVHLYCAPAERYTGLCPRTQSSGPSADMAGQNKKHEL